MNRLTYGTFEKILRSHITPKIAKLRLAEILLTAPMVDARKDDKEFLRKSYNIDSTAVTRLCSGERGLPPSLRQHYAGPDALEYVKCCFEIDIVPYLQDSAKKALLDEVQCLFEQDISLSAATKAYFAQCAAKEKLGDFLAEVYVHAISQRAAIKGQISNLPSQNRFFCGRENLLAEIAGQFASGTTAVGLSGIGGVGKTQLALQYAHLHIAEYGTIWWLNAENRLTLQNGITALLKAHKALPKSADTDSLRQAFADFCSNNRGWLLLYDNAEYGESNSYALLKNFYPADPANGHILTSTRCRNAFENAVQLTVSVWDAETAAMFLQTRSGRSDSAGALKLAEQLGCLPLALEYAAAYIRETPDVDYAAYSQKLERYSVKLLDKKVGQLIYKLTVRETFHITLDRILAAAATDPIYQSAVQLLNICAYLAPDDIEIKLFAVYGKCLPEPICTTLIDELDRDELLRILSRYSLVQIDWGLMSMHRLLQEVLRDEISLSNEILCINYAYGVFYSAFYALHTAPISEIRRFLAASVPHVQAILSRYVQHSQQYGKAVPDKIMVAKEYFSWTALLITDSKQLEGEKLLEACRRDMPISQAAVDFYDMMTGDQTIYLAYTLLLLAQSNVQLGNIPTAFAQYSHALQTADDTLAELPQATEQADNLQTSIWRKYFS